MEKRKNPEKELRNKSGLLFQIGLLIAMMVCVSAFEYRTKSIAIKPIDLTGTVIDPAMPPITTQDPPPPPPKPKRLNPIEVKNEDPIDEISPEVVMPTDEPIEIPISVDEPPIEKAAVGDFIIVEEMPEPDGGIGSFYKYVQKSLRYPKTPRKMGIEGKVFVQFVIDEKGNLVDIEILKGIHTDCDNEVLRIMNNAPKWNPGKQRGVPVRVKKVLPIEFRLN